MHALTYYSLPTQGQRITMNMQLRNHETTISRLVEMLGDEYSASKYLSKCLYSVGMGNNDYINNYFMPQYYNTSQDYTLDQFAQFLIQKYTDQLLVSTLFFKQFPFFR